MGDFDSSTLPTKKILPARYSVKEGDSGVFLTCVEAPNISVHVERGLTVSSSAAKKYPENTIFLDGAAQGKPFIDVSRKVYNLDHHEGCVRAFTLSTCEQAVVLVLKGLDLRVGDWHVYGNEPDLDTIMAIWVILNHMRLTAEEDEIRYKIMPLIRLQGIIDSHGLELRELSGFSHQRQRTTIKQIDDLRSSELELKKEGAWQKVDFLEYTATVLRSIDEMVYSSRHFDDLGTIEELSRISISPDRLAVICASEEGIYEVEEQLRKVHGDRIGLIILQKNEATYTLRQTDPFLPVTLDGLYERLNTLDPHVKRQTKWGGSTDIGGSPRGAGTGLSPNEIADICRWVFQPPDQKSRLRCLVASVVWTVATLILAGLPFAIMGWGGDHIRDWTSSIPGNRWESVVILLAMTVLSVKFSANHKPFQWARGKMAGFGWLGFLPLCAGAAYLGGGAIVEGGAVPLKAGLIALASAIAFELLFRGVMFGSLAQQYRIMRPGGDWFPSVPLVATCLLSACAIVVLARPPQWLMTAGDFRLGIIVWILGALGLGAICGVVRERWRSLTATIVLHAGSIAAVVAISWFMS